MLYTRDAEFTVYKKVLIGPNGSFDKGIQLISLVDFTNIWKTVNQIILIYTNERAYACIIYIFIFVYILP